MNWTLAASNVSLRLMSYDAAKETVLWSTTELDTSNYPILMPMCPELVAPRRVNERLAGDALP